MQKNMHADVNTMGGGGRDFQGDLSLKADRHLNVKNALEGRPLEETVFLQFELGSIGVPVYLGLHAIKPDIILSKEDGANRLGNLERAWQEVSRCGERWIQACDQLAGYFKARVEDVVVGEGGNVGGKQEVDFRKIEQAYYSARRRYYAILLERGVLPMDHPYRKEISEQHRALRLLEAAHSGEITPVTLNTIADSVCFSDADPAFLVFLSRRSGESDPNVLRDLLGESKRSELYRNRDILAQPDIDPAGLNQYTLIVRLENCADELNNLPQGNDNLTVRRDKLRAVARLVTWCMSDDYDQQQYPLYNALPRLIDILHREYTRFAGDPESGNLINGEDITNMSTLAGFASEVVRFE